MTHKEWLDNEYSQWIKALQESTVHNFKEHPMVKRMLGEPDFDLWYNAVTFPPDLQIIKTIDKIDQIGGNVFPKGLTLRYMYYAMEILKRNPSSICEIGGGVGQFYAILRALGYRGTYCIYDHLDVQEFQKKYLREVWKQTNLELEQDFENPNDMVISFYALGEFDEDRRNQYRAHISVIRHGYIAWNPHSGASDDLSIFDAHKITVTPGIEPGVKIIEW